MKVLFLCTGNSARSQMAEVVFNRKANGVHTAVSAGSHPNKEVNPHALDVLKRHEYDISNLIPKHLDQFLEDDINIVITLCDKMKEQCPTFPNKPVYAHFGLADPAEARGSETEVQFTFNKAFAQISNRIDLILQVLKKHEDKNDMQERLDVHAKESSEEE